MPPSALLLAAVLLVLLAGPARAQCPGDLNGDGTVTIDEILAMVNAALYGCPLPGAVPSCPGDPSGHATVTVDEILRAVSAALSGCPTPTATPVASTPTPTATETTTLVPDAPTATATETASATETDTAVPSTATASATGTATLVPNTPTATVTETATAVSSTSTPAATETTTPVPSTPTPTATETSTPVPDTPTATGTETASATETTTPTPSATPTPSPTSAPSACPYTFLDDSLDQGISCDYLGPFNPDPGCPADLEAMFTGGNGIVGVGIATTDLITFVGAVTSATSATLVGYTKGSDTTIFPVSGTIELQQNGQVLVIAPDSSPFDLASASGTDQCAFVQYTGTYVGVLDGEAAPAAPPRHQTSGVQLASFRFR